MNTEQLRAEFEAWLYLGQIAYEPDDLNKREIEIAKVAFQAGRAALQPRPEVDGVTLDGCLETLFRVGEHLGIDYVAARKAPRVPSDVYIKAIKDRAALQSQDREDALTELLDSIDELLKTQEQNAWTSKHKYSLGERMNAGMRYQKARQAIDHARRVEGDGE